MSRSGAKVERITHDRVDHTPGWSDDGRLITDDSYEAHGHEFVDVLDRHGRRLHHVSVGAGGLAADSSLSPDGRRIAFLDGYDNRVTGAEDAKLVVVDLASGARRVLAMRATERPMWMPDGKSILFAHGDVVGDGPPLSPNEYEIHSVRATGGGERVLVGHSMSGPAPSPDGRSFLFFRRPNYWPQFSLWTASADGTHRVRWSEPSYTTPEAYWTPPDGRRIWMLYAGRRHAHALVFDGPGAPRKLPERIHWGPMSWTYDGKLIAWADGNRIKAIRPDGTGYRVLARFRGDGGCEALEWSANDQLLLACAKAQDYD